MYLYITEDEYYQSSAMPNDDEIDDILDDRLTVVRYNGTYYEELKLDDDYNPAKLEDYWIKIEESFVETNE